MTGSRNQTSGKNNTNSTQTPGKAKSFIDRYGRVKVAFATAVIVLIIDLLIYKFILEPEMKEPFFPVQFEQVNITPSISVTPKL